MEENKEMTTYVKRFERSSMFLSLTPILTTLFTLAAIIGYNQFWYYLFLGGALVITISAFPIRKLRTNSLEILKLSQEKEEEETEE